jgi:hypothetical protein
VEAVSNRFGPSAFFGGDFDGDGHRDLLDLGVLTGVEVLRGVPAPGGAKASFEPGLVGPVPVKEGLSAAALVIDLNADGLDDAVLWGGNRIYLLVSKGKPR